jgi:hypothetical protein
MRKQVVITLGAINQDRVVSEAKQEVTLRVAGCEGDFTLRIGDTLTVLLPEEPTGPSGRNLVAEPPNGYEGQ